MPPEVTESSVDFPVSTSFAHISKQMAVRSLSGVPNNDDYEFWPDPSSIGVLAVISSGSTIFAGGNLTWRSSAAAR